ncbi:MAG: M23 family metallopeptidase [Caldisericia bacterium]|jgi:murein DD-endopeptidase MepM/ murein hydrolase activator NlpD|nr:M23 family metallopeptidase [Caldisericia bacterium]MDD3427935.1 M23 family metallopeptidase [Caldisericia bacterium]MDD5689698.1 M23 family metallopeptidase [Caldisericia bacterium]HXK70808.1 M23 family metallopeptidase [Caldisericia bacterium]
MAGKEKGFSVIYIPERGSSRSIHISKSFLYLILIALFAFSIFIFRFASSFAFYKAEYVKVTSFSIEEKQQIMADELYSIEGETTKIKESIYKIKEKLPYIQSLNKEVRNTLGLEKKELIVDNYFKNSEKDLGYFTGVDFSLPYVLSLKEEVNKLDYLVEQRRRDLEIGKASADDYKELDAKTPRGYPVPGPISPGFGWRIHPIFRIPDFHTGVDITASYGYPVKAVADGVVNEAGWSGGYGYTVKIYHRDGIETLYAHCSKLNVKVGDRVKRGQIIAKAGATGTATHSHVHYEIRRDGKAIDPETF